jgi:hypothetical protein
MKVSDETKTNVSCFLGVVGLIGIFGGLCMTESCLIESWQAWLQGLQASAIIGLSAACLGFAMALYPEDKG